MAQQPGMNESLLFLKDTLMLIKGIMVKWAAAYWSTKRVLSNIITKIKWQPIILTLIRLWSIFINLRFNKNRRITNGCSSFYSYRQLTLFKFLSGQGYFLLRILTLIAGFSLLSYYFWVKGGPLTSSIFWCFIFSSVNLYQLYQLYHERKPIRLSKEQQQVYQSLSS